MNKRVYTQRRRFLRMTGEGLAAAALLGAAGCQRGPDPAKIKERAAQYDNSLFCTETSGLTEEERYSRSANEYVDRSPRDVEYCFNCRNFVDPETTGTCGSCNTVDGPINPLGWCKVWQIER